MLARRAPCACAPRAHLIRVQAQINYQHAHGTPRRGFLVTTITVNRYAARLEYSTLSAQALARARE